MEIKPIAEILRERTKTEQIDAKEKGKSILSIEDQIAQLENDLKSSDESDGDDSNISSRDGSQDRTEDDSSVISELESLKVEKGADGKVIRLVSKLDSEKIKPLPIYHLPAANCSLSNRSSGDKKRKIRFSDEPMQHESGLDRTVKEMLLNYQPASLDKKPFYCRVCRFEGSSTEELETHRNSDFHLKASKLERTMSVCQLCHKQFTSPDQLKEHLKGKAHLERKERIISYQQNRKKFC